MEKGKLTNAPVLMEEPFQTEGILPKTETEALAFLKSYPNYDGRNVVVAVWDTGVDPGALGLEKTPDGKPKILDLIDTTGSGDVDTSTIREVQSDGTLLGLSGRVLKLGKWTNPSGKYRVGLKRGFELFPEAVVSRLKKERKEKFFDEFQRQALKDTQLQLESFDLKKPSPSAEEKKERQELVTRLEQIQELDKKYDEVGPIYDCVVFHDGSVWRAVIDTTESGNLVDLPTLSDYSIENQYSTFSEIDLLNFSVNIYDNGNILSIVTAGGSHGTHVAGIVGAYYRDQPELNGIAPGCQIVSVKIGDTRLGTMETGTGLVRAVVATLKHKCDLVNMSYGEPTSSINEGRIIKEISELVKKHRVIFIGSAGNNGPALSTVGAPGGTTSGLIGVGAYVSPDMMSVQYSLREKLPENQYTWSSRGPRVDGAIGVSISGPGGAISPVPNFSLKKNQLMNGTSMASPNVCGNVALILSGLKSLGISYSPHTIQRGLENTARFMKTVEVFAQGSGLIQTLKAFEYFKKHNQPELLNVRFEIQFPSRSAGGLYLREWEETQKPIETTVSVNAVFINGTDNRLQVEFEKRISLVNTATWIQAPKFLVQHAGERTFTILVDPTGLERGVPHFAEILGVDSSSPSAGPLFRIPITVIRPVKSEDPTLTFEGVKFHPGYVFRKFYVVPEGATYAELSVSGRDIDTNRRYMLHTFQLVPQKNFSKTEFSEFFLLFPNDTVKYRFNVVPGSTIEFALAQFWSSIGTSTVDMKIEFHGFSVSGTLALQGDSTSRVDVRSAFRNELLEPSVTLTKIHQTLYPNKLEKKTCRDPREILPQDRQIYEFILNYSFKLDNPTKVVIKTSILHEILYESPLESQFWMVFDANKQLIAKGDYRPKPFQLSKGSYVIRLQLRHDDLPTLEKLKDLSIILERKLDKKINFEIYSSQSGAVVGSSKLTKKDVKKGGREAFFIKASSELPKDGKVGEVLAGSLKLFKNPEDKSLKLKGMPFMYTIPPPKSTPPAPASNAPEGTVSEQFEESLLQQKITFLSTLVDQKKFSDFHSIAKGVILQHSKNLQLLQLQLKAFDQAPDRTSNLDSILGIADSILHFIDTTALAAHFGLKVDNDDPAQTKLRQEMTKKKDILIDTLYRKGLALSDKGLAAENEANLKILQQWVEPNDSKFLQLSIRLDQSRKFYARALATLRKNLESCPEKKMIDLEIELLEQLGWKHWVQYLKKWSLIQYPSTYPPF